MYLHLDIYYKILYEKCIYFFKLFSVFLSNILSLDFERHDDDELGFRKNDIITVISQKDEHCWIGELNGLRGTSQ